jgi:hypothetical protein
MKRLIPILALLALTGCASVHPQAPKLGHGDTAGFDAKGASVKVAYDFGNTASASSSGPASFTVTADTPSDAVERIRAGRAEEIYALLKGYGFRPAPEGEADYTVHVVENGETSDPDSIGLMMLGSFSMLIIPSPWTATRGYQYELWSAGQKVHTIDTESKKKQLFGLIGIPLLALNAGGSIDRKARSEAHDSVLSMWIEQGSFE